MICRQLVILGAVALMSSACSSGSPAATPVPVVSVAPVATTSPVVTAPPSSSAAALPVGEVAVAPGRYFTDVDGYRFTLTISTTGWTSGGDAVFRGDHDKEPPDFGGLFLWGDDPGVYTEACQWEGTFLPRNAIPDLASALALLDDFETSVPADVALGDYQGKRLQLTVPSDVAFDECQEGQYRSFEGRWYQAPGQTDDIRVMDLDGTRRLVRTTYHPGTTAATRAELDQMVDSLEIEPIPR